MEKRQFKTAIEALFGDLLKQFPEGEEFAFYDYGPDAIKRIGCSTNISPEIVKQAANHKVDQIITHHDAWSFLYGMKEECHALLQEYGISHFFVHLPLDYAEFGTCGSLFKVLDIHEIIQHSYHHEDRTILGLGELAAPLSLEDLVQRVSRTLEEDVKWWKNSDRLIKRVGILTGAGHSTKSIQDALNADCDVYITGEKTLYSVQYARYVGLNMIVGSHTFTEIFGVKSLAEKLSEKLGGLEIMQLAEEHFE